MRARVIAAGAATSIFACGCGGVQYAAVSAAASSRLEQARTLGAEKFAPYSYYFAKEHLDQARVEASRASYSDAIALAREAEESASAAIESIRKTKRGAP